MDSDNTVIIEFKEKRCHGKKNHVIIRTVILCISGDFYDNFTSFAR